MKTYTIIDGVLIEHPDNWAFKSITTSFLLMLFGTVLGFAWAFALGGT